MENDCFCVQEDDCCRGLKVALIHAAVSWKDKEKNISKLLGMNKKAARARAQIILNTELATTGHAFEGRCRPYDRDHTGPYN